MEKTQHIDTVYQYNEIMGVETLNPLVSVFDMTQCKPMERFRAMYGLYCIFLKEVKCGDLYYGRQTYDYQEGTIVTIAPGQILGVDSKGEKFTPKGWVMVFHPDLIRGTQLGREIGNYHYFSYEVNEALHLSKKERDVVVECFKQIQGELEHDIDKHSKKLIVSTIQLLLDYFDRFYDRQFITRENVNKDIITRFESVLNGYLASDRPSEEGLPSVAFCADNLNLSPNYFGDLIKKETGVSAQDYIQNTLIDKAKERLYDETKSISEVAYSLGFKYPQHFSRLFKQRVGVTPNEYRSRSTDLRG